MAGIYEHAADLSTFALVASGRWEYRLVLDGVIVEPAYRPEEWRGAVIHVPGAQIPYRVLMPGYPKHIIWVASLAHGKACLDALMDRTFTFRSRRPHSLSSALDSAS